MVTITPTAATGATIKPGPMVTVVPERAKTDEQLASFAPGSGLNAPYLADQLSAFLAHERDGVALYTALQALTNNPALQSKYGQSREESEQAVAVYEAVVGQLGGSAQYVSPPARLTMQTDAKLLEAFLLTGSADELAQEMAGVQAVLAASALCVGNTEVLKRLAREADGDVGAALLMASSRLEGPQRGHLDWAMTPVSPWRSRWRDHESPRSSVV
jgi:hypothetical protein